VSAQPSAAPEPEAAAKSDKRLNPMKVRRMKERLGSIEKEVGQLEAGIADYESALANFVSAEETRRIAELLEASRAELAALMGEWRRSRTRSTPTRNRAPGLLLSGSLLFDLAPGADLRRRQTPAQRFRPGDGRFRAAHRAAGRFLVQAVLRNGSLGVFQDLRGNHLVRFWLRFRLISPGYDYTMTETDAPIQLLTVGYVPG